jgi:hypothetical protein
VTTEEYLSTATDELFQLDLCPLAPMDHRDFTAKNPDMVIKYITSKMKYLTDHRFFERLQLIENAKIAKPLIAEALDRDMIRAAIHMLQKACSKTTTLH